ncbi:COUP transcription factor 1 [Nematostella vectensis]|uniref:COUP transcription factor 1 n=1 Tax=Nematostella vectensis TaxID=45351 RepID=UPI002076EDAB|nr:COUP transcription factor 1 [Nematostella vectensis]
MSSWSQMHEVYWYDNPDKTIECAVCSAPSSGRHYGVFTCEGCKCFFNRTVRYKLTYTCESSGSCRVDKQNRTQCQACRFKKCATVGMRREAIRRGRPTKYSYISRSSKSFTPQYDLISVLTQLERSIRPPVPYPSSGLQSSPVSMYHRVCSILVSTLDWSRRVPMFANLDVCEQYSVLRSRWCEMLIVSAAQYEVHIDGIPLAYEVEMNPGFCNEKQIQLKRSLRNFQESVWRLRGLEEAEYACLKTIILFSPDASEGPFVQEFESLQELVLSALDRFCRARFPEEPSRYGKVLLKLMSLKSVIAEDIETLVFSKLFPHSSVSGIIRNHLVSDVTSAPESMSPAKTSPVNQ